MKNKIAALALAAITLFAFSCGCTSQTPASNVSATTFTVGFDAAFPPYGYTNENGEYVGFDLDLAAEVCKRNGWELVKKPIEWDSKDFELTSGTIDCIWNGFTINGRESDYEWTKAYVDNSQVIVVSVDSGIAALSDLAGKTVLVQADSSALAALTDTENQENVALAASFKSLTQVPDYLTAFLTLESGAADAIAMDIGVAEYEIAERNGSYTILSEPIASEQYGIGFKLGNAVLRDKVQATIDEMAADGTFLAIAEKWGLEEAVCIGK